MTVGTSLLLFSGKGGGGGGGGHQLGPQIVPVPRPALGLVFPPGDYPTALPFTPPKARSLDFYRGNFCGLHLPGAPFVPGSNDRFPETVMACLLDNYPEAFQHEYLEAYAKAGYTHLQRSVGHAMYYGHSPQDYFRLSRMAREQYGLYCDHWILGGEALKTPDQDAGYWAPILDPILSEIVNSGTMDLCCVGWQLDQLNNNRPGNALISIIAYVAETIPQSTPLYTHWMNEALAWWKTGGEVWTDRYGSLNVTDRFTWWQAMQPYLTGGHHQGNTTMALTDPGLYQAKILDTLDYFGGDTGKGNMGQSHRGGGSRPFALTAFECTAQDQFDGRCSELDGDRAGYLLMCTTSHTGLPMGGYGNGARRPDGTAL